MAEFFSGEAFEKAKRNGIDLYAKMDLKDAMTTDPMARYTCTPHVGFSWNYSMTKLQFQPSKSSRVVRSKHNFQSESIRERPPWEWKLSKDMPDAFGKIHEEKRRKQDAYVPWYDRLGMRAGTRRAATARGPRLAYKHYGSNIW